MKRFISLFLCILCISMISIPVFATGTDPEPDYNDNQMEVNADFDKTPGSYSLTIGAVKQTNKAGFTEILAQYRIIISIITGIGALTMLLMFLMNFAKLGQSGGNPQQRQAAIIGLLFTGIATALLGSIMTFFTFFYNFVN